MHPETEQRLATLEVILQKNIRYYLPCHENGANLQPYVWNTNIQDKFTSLNLITSEGWIKETDPEVIFTNWLWSEQNGLASQIIYLYKKDKANILLDEITKNTRYQHYYNLLSLLIDNLENLKAFNISCNDNYSLSLVVGKIPDRQRWICLSTTVPQETPEFIKDLIQCSPLIEEVSSDLKIENLSKVETQINDILMQLDTINIYGYYDGGYCHTHKFKVICTSEITQEAAVNKALLSSGLVEIYNFEKFTIQGRGGWGFDNYEESLTKFLNAVFPDLLLYRFCFWDYEHLYLLGKTGDRDFVGVALHSQFTYNP
ncbi:MAG: hypothetical protein KME09_00410 [Pleurocapsa minor HA4230-MV1]|jgi:hypothetical protein|nr:hypothetical protein [Pleurocapsa minor HA4230-MV1]